MADVVVAGVGAELEPGLAVPVAVVEVRVDELDAVGAAGAGSAVLGLTQFLCGALAALWGGIGGTASATPTVLGMLLIIALSALAGTLGRRGVRTSQPPGL